MSQQDAAQALEASGLHGRWLHSLFSLVSLADLISAEITGFLFNFDLLACFLFFFLHLITFIILCFNRMTSSCPGFVRLQDCLEDGCILCSSSMVSLADFISAEITGFLLNFDLLASFLLFFLHLISFIILCFRFASDDGFNILKSSCFGRLQDCLMPGCLLLPCTRLIVPGLLLQTVLDQTALYYLPIPTLQG